MDRIDDLGIMTRILTHSNGRAKTACLLMIALLCVAGQARTWAQSASRYMGAITGISGDTLTVKTDAGEQHEVKVPAEASIKRIEPGQKDLSSAATITLTDLAVGDRVLVKLDPNATGTAQAALVVAIKQADVAQKQQKEREDWQKRGVAGLVKSVDTGAGAIVITTGVGPTLKKVTVHVSKDTVLKRYAPGSVRFDQAQPAPLTAIQPGDQLRSKGNKTADGGELDAEAVVSGTFRNIAGTVSSLDAGNSSLVVKDLATKKQVTIHISSDAQMRRIPEQMAQMLAARLKGTGAPNGGHNWGAGAAPGGPAGAKGMPGGPGNGMGSGMGSGDPQQMLSRLPAIQLADLQKGQAVMVVATDGTAEVNAITLLAGVEPLLEAPEATNLLSNWSMGGGGAESAAGPQ